MSETVHERGFHPSSLASIITRLAYRKSNDNLPLSRSIPRRSTFQPTTTLTSPYAFYPAPPIKKDRPTYSAMLFLLCPCSVSTRVPSLPDFQTNAYDSRYPSLSYPCVIYLTIIGTLYITRYFVLGTSSNLVPNLVQRLFLAVQHARTHGDPFATSAFLRTNLRTRPARCDATRRLLSGDPTRPRLVERQKEVVRVVVLREEEDKRDECTAGAQLLSQGEYSGTFRPRTTERSQTTRRRVSQTSCGTSVATTAAKARATYATTTTTLVVSLMGCFLFSNSISDTRISWLAVVRLSFLVAMTPS